MDYSIQSAEFFSVDHMKRTIESGKLRVGAACVMGKQQLVQSLEHFFSHMILTIICHSFSIPLELCGNYIPLDTNTALFDLYDDVPIHQAHHQDVVPIVRGVNNSAKPVHSMPDFLQHITCHTRDEKILDHCYTPSKMTTNHRCIPHSGNWTIPPSSSCLNMIKG